MFDIHSHILPGVDDGSKDMDMTLKMVLACAEEGITDIIATPHHSRHHGNASPEKLHQVYEEVCTEAKKICPSLQIYLGSELFSSHDLLNDLAQQRALTMMGTNLVLIEFQPSEGYREIAHRMQTLQMEGYRPILAHAERYQCLVKKPELTEELVDMGCFIQVNTASVTGENGFAAKHYVKKLLKYEMVHLLGTDAHNMGRRAPQMKKCVEYIRRKYGSEYAERLAHKNAEELFLH